MAVYACRGRRLDDPQLNAEKVIAPADAYVFTSAGALYLQLNRIVFQKVFIECPAIATASKSMFSFSAWTDANCCADKRIGANRRTQSQISVSVRASVPAGRMKGTAGYRGNTSAMCIAWLSYWPHTVNRCVRFDNFCALRYYKGIQ